MLRRASCGHCGGWLPLDCGWFTFRLPPETVRCGRCGETNQTTPAYRSTFLGMQMFRAATLAGIALGFSLALFEPNRFLFVAICGSVFGLLAGMLVGTLLAVFLAPIVRTVLDARREMRQLDQAHFEDADEPTTPIQPNN